MTGRTAGAGLFLMTILALGGCASPMGQSEAVQLANTSLRKYCSGHGGCAQLRLAHAQKIKDRWLIDFETQAGLYTVTVDRSGAARVSVWDKNLAR